MIKKEIKKIFKEKMTKLDFEVKGNVARRMIEEYYQVEVALEHHPFDKGYYIEFGVKFLEKNHIDYSYNIDWNSYFLFTSTKDQNLYDFDLSEIRKSSELINYFDYKNKTIKEFIFELDLNLLRRLPIAYNKYNILTYYQNRINVLCSLPIEKLEKITKLGNFDIELINETRKKYGYSTFIKNNNLK